MVSITAKGFWPGIEFGESLHFKSLRVVPLIGPSNNDPSYRLFGPDVAGDVQVEEVDAAPLVAHLFSTCPTSRFGIEKLRLSSSCRGQSKLYSSESWS